MIKLKSGFFVMFISAIVVLSSCNKKKELSTIPQDAGSVLSFKAKDIAEKGGLEKFKEMNLFQMMNEELQNENKEVAELFSNFVENPKEIGINFDEPSYIFYVTKGMKDYYLCGTGFISDKDKFEDFVTKTANLGNKEESKLEKTEKYQYISFDNTALVSWDKNKYLSVVKIGEEDMEKLKNYTTELFSLEKENSLFADDNFKDFIKKSKDVNLWLSTSNIVSKSVWAMLEMGTKMAGEDERFDIGMLKENKFHYFVNFDKGKATVEVKTFLNDKASKYKEFIKDKIDNNVLEAIPANNVAAFAFAIKPDKFFEFLKSSVPKSEIKNVEEDIKENLDLSLEEDIIKSLTGDFAFCFLGMAKEVEEVASNKLSDEDMLMGQQNESKPEIIIAIGIKDEAVINKIISKFSEKMKIEKVGEYKKMTIDKTVFFGIKNDILLITTKESYIVKFYAEGCKKNLIASKKTKELFQSPAAGILNLDIETYDTETKEVLKSEIGNKQYELFELTLSIFKNVIGKTQKDKTSFIGELNMTDKNENSLKTILHHVDKNFNNAL